MRTRSRPTLALLAALPLAVASAVASCSHGYSIPKDRPILGWYGFTEAQNWKMLPRHFREPAETSCAPDTTRVYIAELFTDGINDAEVNWHWAPVVGGPDTKLPTLSQPEFSLAGTIEVANTSGDDVLADHPFGPDVNADVLPDEGYGFLGGADPDGDDDSLLHTEVERRIFPRAELGWEPLAGDRTIMRGVWILDCGHPPYGPEMHPPTMLGYARTSDSKTTIAAVVVEPYRSTLLFNPDVTLANDFADTTRYTKSSTKPFEETLVDAIIHAVLNKDDHLETHNLMQANRFAPLDFLVCAPLPQPPGTTLDAHWRFTARTGVHVAADDNVGRGCVRFTATMGSDYLPMALPYVDAAWPWDELSASASNQLGQPIDVRQAIIDDLTAEGLDASAIPAFQVDHPPRVDAYDPLTPRAGADQDSPTAIVTGADDQPFPFYGRVSVGWK